MAKKWYVLHTYSGYENKVKKNLETRIETMGLENNVFGIEIPTEMVTEIKDGGRRVESEKKVFPGYVLVRMELDDRSWAAVRNTPGVTGFVGSQGNPSPLTREEYNKIMKRTSREAPKRPPLPSRSGRPSRSPAVLLPSSMALLRKSCPRLARSRSWSPSSVAKLRLSSRSIRWRVFNLENTKLVMCPRGPGLLTDRAFSDRESNCWKSSER